MNIQLGDIIQIGDESAYRFIEFIDQTQIKMLTAERKGSIIRINPDGTLEDTTITKIDIISRAESPSYARQNGLMPGVWVDIKFGGELPSIITGEITNLDEDQIELRMADGDDHIYIDFAYRGLPPDLLIETITKREPVQGMGHIEEDRVDEDRAVGEDEEHADGEDEEHADGEDPADDQSEYGEDEQDPNAVVFLDADKLDLAPKITITHIVDVPESQQRFGIDSQANDMLDDFLSTIPNQERNLTTLNNIHRMIDRYKQLRSTYIDGAPHNGVEHRPLAKRLQALDTKLYWLMPVSRIRKHVYDMEMGDQEDLIDAAETTLAQDRISYEDHLTHALQYDEVLTALKRSWTPYAPPTETVLETMQVGDDITSIVDNTDDYMCSAVEKGELVHHKFFTQVYNRGQTKLETYKNEQKVVQSTKNDTIHIKSFLSVNESAVEFSRVTLPGTDILMKSNMAQHFIAYWRLLHSQTRVDRVLLDKHYKRSSYQIPTEYVSDGTTEYADYLERLVPPTKSLIRRYKRATPAGDLTLRTAVRELEPFMVYQHDLCKQHLQAFEKYLGEKIGEMKQKYEARLESLAFLSTAPIPYETKLTAITKGVADAYGLGEKSDSEQWSALMRLDEGRFFHMASAVDAVDLMVSEGLLRFGEAESPTPNSAKERVIAKEYASMAALENDNGQECYYDMKYDPTFYDLANEYTAEMANESNKEEFLSMKLQETNGLSRTDAAREARSMVSGRRTVEDGDYAVYNGAHYRRTKGKWAHDPEDAPIAEKKAPSFDERLQQNKEEMTKLIHREHQRAMSRLTALNAIRNNHRYRYEKQKYDVDGAPDALDAEVSPYEELRDLVLGEEDFVKRQHFIDKFITEFTRPANPDEPEGWFYCPKSGAQLVPTFMKRLADAFLNHEDYLRAVEVVCADQGKLSDDESCWVDKFTGYPIVPINFSAQEGYTEGGFKQKTRDVMARETGEGLDQILPPILSVEAQMVSNVVQALALFIGIDMQPGMEFILQNTVAQINRVLPSREAYAKMMEEAKTKGKKKSDSYEKKLHQAIITLSLAYLLVAIQTNIPTLRTQKRHPGCVKSFGGYPIGDENDRSGIKYLVCVAYNIKSKIAPWDAIYKMKQESLFEKVSQLLEKVVVPSVEAQRRITQKRIHLRTNPDETEIHRGLIQWTTFRPSLLPVNPGVVEPVTADFKKRMAEALKKGGSDQFELINTSMSKIMFHSLKIQQLVEGVVQKSEPLLASNAGSPYLENACCHDGAMRTIRYFVENAGDIATHNDNAQALQHLLMDVRRMGQPSILFDASNTKYRPVPPVEDYSEETIYRAFIHYCRYNSKIPMGEEVRAICSEKPAEFDNSEPFEEQIRKLKRDGYNYNSDSLHQLMSIVYRKNIQPLPQTGAMDVLSIHVVQSLIESMDDSLIPRAFKEQFEKMVENGHEEVRAMKNFLGTQNEFMMDQIERFFRAYGVKTSLLSCFNTRCSLSYFTRVLPNIVANKVDYSEIDPPKHWKLSQRHKGDFQNFMNKYYIKIYKLFDDQEALSILLRVREVTADFETLWSHAAIVDEQMEELLRQFYFMVVLTEYIEPGNDMDDYLNDDDEREIIDGDREKRNQKVALILDSFGELIISETETINFTYDSLMERVHRAKEKEKDVMTDYLRDMTDEQREIENLLKNNRLGGWSKGLQKGLREYQQGTYDEEREAMDKQALAELRAGEKNVITGMNRDIYAMEHIAEEQTAQQIEADEMRLDHLGEDDDHGELDGDENY